MAYLIYTIQGVYSSAKLSKTRQNEVKQCDVAKTGPFHVDKIDS